jgi:hypothetical protein
MKSYILLFILFFSISLFSCKNNNNINNQVSDTTLNVQAINNDTIELSSCYLFNNLSEKDDPYIFTLQFYSGDSNLWCGYRSESWSKTAVFNTTYIKRGDTIILNKFIDSLSTFGLMKIDFQIPDKFLLLPGGNLKVISLNKKIHNDPNEFKNKYSSRIISNIFDILKVSTCDSVKYFQGEYTFESNKFVYQNPCSNMDSYYLGISYARDQLGGGLVADCDYLYQIAITQTANVDHYCFCKGVNKWLSDNGRSY